MITKFLKIIFRNFPILKGKIWKIWYTYLGNTVKTSDLKFMNYGYFREDFNPSLSEDDEKERYPIQLYHYLCSKVGFSNSNVLEVGSGRGGGADYISRTFSVTKICGLDISSSAIDLCKKFYTSNKLSFLQGSADMLPFEDNIYDLVINVESSHCYPNFNNFLKEVYRVLKPSSYFLITDFRPSSEVEGFHKSISNYYKIIYQEEITSNIITALDLMSVKRSKQIKSFMPSFLSSVSSSFAGIKGSELYESFENRELRYFMYVLQVEKGE